MQDNKVTITLPPAVKEAFKKMADAANMPVEVFTKRYILRCMSIDLEGVKTPQPVK